MIHKLLAICLALALCLSLGACGDKPTPLSQSEAETTPETFGNLNVSAPVETAQTTAAPESAETPSEAPVETDGVIDEAQAERFHNAAEGAIMICDAIDQLPYSSTDPMYFWRAMGYMVGLIQSDMETMSVTATDVELYAYALFGDFSGEIPSLTEEDPLVSRDGENYLVHLPELGNLVFSGDGTPTENSDGTSSAQISIEQDGVVIGQYLVTYEAYSGPPSGQSIFAHSILGLGSVS